MEIVNCSWDEFHEKVYQKNIYCFGAGEVSNLFLDLLESKKLLCQIQAFVDNSIQKIGTYKQYKEHSYKIISAEEMTHSMGNGIVLITCSDTESVVRQLMKLNNQSEMQVFSMYIMLSRQFMKSEFRGNLRTGNERKIPKKIHYCWFGGQEIPEKNRACIESWRRYCPDYEIIEWNEHNYDYTKNQYMYEAYKCKKWGFVSDFARLDIIYLHGGIYLDVDVEIIRNIDELLYQEAFSGFDSQLHVNLGSGFGAEPGNVFIKELRDYYDTVHFLFRDGTHNLATCMFHQQNIFGKYKIKLDDTLQKICGMTVYPMIVMNGIDMNAFLERRKECTCFCHHMAGSWLPERLAEARKKRVEYIRSYL